MKSIKTKAMIFSLLLILFTITTLGFNSYQYFENILVNEVNQAVVKVAQESADHLNNYVKQYVTPLIAITEDENIKSMNWEKQKQIIKAQINPLYLTIAVVDTNGVAHYIDETILDLSDRDYIAEALTGKLAFSEVLTSRKTGEPAIMVAVPIYDEELIKGALIARLDVDFLSDFALSRGYGESGRAYVISNQGSLISRPETEKSYDEYNLYDIAEADEDYDSFSDFVRSSMQSQSGYGEYSLKGEDILMGYASVEETNWKIYIGTNKEDILDGLTGLKKMFIPLMLMTMFICTTAAWVFVNKFTKPIMELDSLFSQGALGDLTIRFTPKTKDEIGRVGISFNRMMDKIKTLTQYDPLTKLLNQFVLEKDVDALTHSDDDQDFSLIMVAIDKFSFINESFGYTSGDSILFDVSKRISKCLTEPYQIYRYKGDEFVVLCKDNISDDEIDAKVQLILSALKENFYINGKAININVNIGVFTWNVENRSEDPLKAVTQAKNYAKYLGSNQMQKFNQNIYNIIMNKKELQADIINGIKEEQFFLVYQPLFYLNNENIAEVEALIRWNHPEKGLLYPDQFIEMAEQAGSIINIDQWVLETACKQLKTWMNNKKPPIILSVNISAKTFETKRFIPDLISIVNHYDIDPSLLQLEITERMVIQNVEESISKLKELRNMGIHVAIDDFGIGYSSLSYIVRLPIDSIKIDKSFVQNIASSKESKSIVSTIINLCKTLKLNVIAEGIESKLELDYLKANNCDIGQGYYFSKPVSINEIESKHFNTR